MDITRDNFETHYDEIEKQIIDCDFCSIDCEFTGITTYKDLNSFDTLKSRYDKIRKNDQNFLILQFGLCLFKRTETNTYNCTAYNFYLFPQSNEKSKYGRQTQFTCLNSSIEFLMEQNFDFNKVFLKGLTYLSKDNEERTREELIRRLEANEKKAKTIAYPSNKKELKDDITNIMNEIEAFVTDEQTDKTLTKEFKFSNALVKIFVEKNIRNKYRDQLEYKYNSVPDSKERIMVLSKIQQSQDTNSELNALDKQVGFSKIIWLLSRLGKLIIGHNMLIDIMQMLKQFFGSLPDRYDDFKSMVHTLFPNLIDTKYIATVQPLKDLIQNSNLGELDKILAREPFDSVNVKIENCKYSVSDDKLHEAGYDAFLTGFCYIRMLGFLQVLNKDTSREGIEKFYLNKIHFMKGYDVVHLDFVNVQEVPSRDHVFYIEFPSSWEIQDLYDLFSPFGNIYISWLNKTSAFIALLNVDNVKKVAAQLVGTVGREFKVYFYKTYLNQISKNNQDSNGNCNGNGNGNGNTNQKRSRDATPNGTDTNNTTDESVNNNNIKKVKVNDTIAVNDKPFQECVDW